MIVTPPSYQFPIKKPWWGLWRNFLLCRFDVIFANLQRVRKSRTPLIIGNDYLLLIEQTVFWQSPINSYQFLKKSLLLHYIHFEAFIPIYYFILFSCFITLYAIYMKTKKMTPEIQILILSEFGLFKRFFHFLSVCIL